MSNQQDCKITLYWLSKSRAQRIIWLFEELKLEYELKVFKRRKDFLAPPELKEIHPLGKSPVIGVKPAGAEKEIILAESGTIVEYLSEHFGAWLIPERYPKGKEGVIGAETQEWMRYRYLMHYAEGSLMTLMVNAILIHGVRNAPVPFFLKPFTSAIANKVDSSYINVELKKHMDFLEGYMAEAPGGGDFVCGNSLSAADFMMIFPLECAVGRVPLNETNYPKLYSWVRRMQARDAYKKAGEKATEASGEEFIPFSDLKV